MVQGSGPDWACHRVTATVVAGEVKVVVAAAGVAGSFALAWFSSAESLA
jgi:hypothetical protein